MPDIDIDLDLQAKIVADLQKSLDYNRARATASKDQAETIKFLAEALYYAQRTLQSMEMMCDD